MKLTEQQILDNWETFRKNINTLFPEKSDALNVLYDEMSERICMMPASGVEYYHNAFAGGYVDHVLRVAKCAETLYNTWKSMGADMSGYTLNELLFAAYHHDLGKVGFPGEGNENYIPNDSEWHRKNQGKIYTHNPKLPFSLVPDLSIYLLQSYNVPISWNEFLAIRIHDGMYDDANKAYFLSRSKDAKLRTNMQVILHHADHMAAMIEYDKVKTDTNISVTPTNTSISKKHRLQKLESVASNPAQPAPDKDLTSMFTELFGD
jgi:hypothetical protein